MKIRSMQFKVLITVISAMLAITIFIGGLSIYEVDNFVQRQTEDYVNVTCEKDASQINDVFGDMEKSVHIMESYVHGLIKNEAEVKNPVRQAEILSLTDDMFTDVAKNTDGAVAYYMRFSPEISHNTCGFFYSKMEGVGDFISLKPTDLSLYDKDDTEHVGWYWQVHDAGEPVWMLPYYNQNSKMLMISYVVPLYYNDNFIGVVGMDFNYNLLTDKIHKMKIYENGFAHLEYKGNVIHREEHDEDVRVYEDSNEYLRVSKELKNGMTIVLSASRSDIKQIRYNIALKILFVVLLLTILFSLIAVFTVRRIVHPLKTLTEASVKLSDGDYDVEIVHSNTYEIKLLSTAFENMTRRLKENEKHQHLLAYRDSMTGLRNTTAYKSWMTEFDKEIEGGGKVFGVMVLDVNHLKDANDKHGHEVGNQLIITSSRIISGVFKRSPVFRIGGDEFVVILQNRDLEDLEVLIAKFDEECKNATVQAENENIPVIIAKGFALYDASRDAKFVDVFNRADEAMYENKREIKGLK